MCYRGGDNLIDFTGIHLAALTGDNGQGKSALLDAMTYALWGKSRATSADDLVTRGESDMEVNFEFELNGSRYRAVRKRSMAGKGSSSLELQARRNDGFFAPLSEPTLRETQQRITSLLRLDYDTFVNSAFLLQGRADEFTTKRPGDRKQILADILGLAEYDQYAERAKEKSRAAETERKQFAQELEHIRAIVAEIPTFRADVLAAHDDEERLDAQFRTENETLQQLLDQRRDLDAKEEQRVQAEVRLRDTQAQLSETRVRLETHRTRLAKTESLLARAFDIEAALHELEQARRENEKWDDLFRQSTELNTNATALQREVDHAKAELEGEIRAVEREIKGYTDTLHKHRHREEELAKAQQQVALLEQTQARRDEQQTEHQLVQTRLTLLKAENEQLRLAMQELTERINLLKDTTGANCPICRQPLSPDAQATALEEATTDGTRMGDKYRANQADMKQLTHASKTLQDAIAGDNRQLSELGKWQRIAGEAASIAEQMLHAREGQTRATTQLTTLRAQIEAGDYAHDAQRKLADLAATRAELGYDRARHQQVRTRVQELAARQQEFDALNSAQTEAPHLRDMIAALHQTEQMWVGQLQTTQADIDRLTTELRERDVILRKIGVHQTTVREIQSNLVAARRRHGGAKQKLADAERYAERQPEVERQCTIAAEERALYDQLVNAFGRKGIQAMIIESAIPDIESTANELLARMTAGRMSVSIQTQKELKGGGAAETLDIFISDEQGERPYETFSGGEAFRVNFALRIALSQLLANRAGTTLRTLMIDEGFGSQDAQGRESLIEAITSVQDDFDCILVITHIEELKDAFPIRLNVIKGPQGSKVYIEE